MKPLYLFIIILSGVVMSCDPDRVYEYHYEFEDDVWKQEQVLKYGFIISDTTEYYNLYINIRNSNEYLYRNLYLFLTITAPDGNYSKDTVECILADTKGKWLGKGAVNLLDNRILYKKNILFPLPGNYHVSFEQAMRDSTLEAIRNVGFRLEKAAKNKEI